MTLAALVFYWAELERQVRIEGRVSEVDSAASDAYFASRPRESRIGAWASPQSQEISGRQYLEERNEFYLKKFEGAAIPRPSHWGGYVLTPERIEFWQGRKLRLHDRILYTLEAGRWRISRLAP